MPAPRCHSETPEGRRAYRARLIAEHRCTNCTGPLPPEETRLCCAKCRRKHYESHFARYCKNHAANPPDFARVPGKPFRPRRRIDNSRRVSIVLDDETYFWIKACRGNYCLSAAYEPYQVSEVIRRLLRLLDAVPGPLVPPPFTRLPRNTSCGLHLVFECDGENYARLSAYHQSVGGNFSSAVRACICYAAQYAVRLPIVNQNLRDEEAKRILWPGYAELAPPSSEGGAV